MACPPYDHARHGVFDLRCRVSDFPFYQVRCNSERATRKYESGGLGLTAGDFSVLSGSICVSSLHFVDHDDSCVDVPCANCVPVLSLPVCLFTYLHSPL
jgi:hypothetical protein